ncbi:MAG: hypothetical protein HY866_12860 [Chloroflexi bacterium]|nr:hypothetical protein [Chloroflexota bacterium]
MRGFARVMVLAVLAFSITACDAITRSGEIADLETENAQLQGTLDMVGTPMLTMMALEAAATQNMLLQLQLGQAQGTALAANSTLTVMQLSGGGINSFQPTQIPAAPPGDQSPGFPTTDPILAPTPSTGGFSQTRFTQTVTATDIDQQDCPIGSATTFDATTPTIYVNTQINYLPAGSTFGARWTVNGTLFFDDVECWIPDKDWYNICAYCSIVPDGTAFDAGTWTVELLLDGQVLAQAQFQIPDAAADGSTTTDTMSQ